jgi:hypothetical protein
MSLQYAELKPVPLISYADAYALRATKATPILEQVSAMGNILQESADKEAWLFVRERENLAVRSAGVGSLVIWGHTLSSFYTLCCVFWIHPAASLPR